MKRIRVIIVEDDLTTLNVHKELLDKEHDIEIVATAQTKEDALTLIKLFNPDVVLLDINLTSKEDQYGTDIAIELSIKMPHIRIIMLSALLNEDTIRSTIGLNVACNYLLKSKHNIIPKAIRDAYEGTPVIEDTIVKFILQDYQETLKTTMNKLTTQHIKILELFYRGYCVEDVANVMNLEVQSVRNYQQAIAKRCLGWKWRYKKLSTLELANRAKIMGLF